MITGDDTITIRRLYQEAEKVTLTMKLVLVGNCKPHWRHNRAMTNRFGYFAFRNMFVSKPTQPHHRKKDDKLIKLMLTTAHEGAPPEIRANQPHAGALFLGDTSFSTPLNPRFQVNVDRWITP